MSDVLDTFKEMVKAEVVDMVTVNGKIAHKDKVVAHAVNSDIDAAKDFHAVVDAVKAENFFDEADLFRILVDAIEEEGV